MKRTGAGSDLLPDCEVFRALMPQNCAYFYFILEILRRYKLDNVAYKYNKLFILITIQTFIKGSLQEKI
jgi:hypothetical protein